ncbi:MAG TPA: hypothetical protein VGD64_02755 [Acidisarcina sp.]
MKISRIFLLSPLVVASSAWASSPAPPRPAIIALEPYANQNVYGLDTGSLLTILSNEQIPPARYSKTCYAIRSYRFRLRDPNSDVINLESYSTCQAADLFSRKDAGERPANLQR